MVELTEDECGLLLMLDECDEIEVHKQDMPEAASLSQKGLLKAASGFRGPGKMWYRVGLTELGREVLGKI